MQETYPEHTNGSESQYAFDAKPHLDKTAFYSELFFFSKVYSKILGIKIRQVMCTFSVVPDFEWCKDRIGSDAPNVLKGIMDLLLFWKYSFY